MTEETFKTTREAAHPSELISVRGYYELNLDKDDRPEHMKVRIKQEEEMLKLQDPAAGSSDDTDADTEE